MDPGPFWRLLHLEIEVDPLPTHPYLVGDGGDVHLLGSEVMNLVIALDPLLMVLLTFLLLADAACLCARGPWARFPPRKCSEARSRQF